MEEMIQIQVSKSQAAMIERACEFYARVINGQFSEIGYQVSLPLYRMKAINSLNVDYEQINRYLYAARALLFPELGADQGTHWGVGRNADSDLAWDIMQVLRHERWMHDNPGSTDCNVASHEPIQWGDEPMCTAKYVPVEPEKG